MKTIRFNAKSARRDRGPNGDVLHIETDGCIVNITVGLTDVTGAPVTRVDVQCDQYAGEAPWTLPDFDNQRGVGIRVRRMNAWDQLAKNEQAALREACGMAEAQPNTPDACLPIDAGDALVRRKLATFVRDASARRGRAKHRRVAWYVITDEGRAVRRQDPETCR